LVSCPDWRLEKFKRFEILLSLMIIKESMEILVGKRGSAIQQKRLVSLNTTSRRKIKKT